MLKTVILRIDKEQQKLITKMRNLNIKVVIPNL